MNLVLDFGNTRVKAASFDQAQLVSSQAFASVDELLQSDLFNQNYQAAIIGTVTNDHEAILPELLTRFPVHVFSHQSLLPIANHYSSARTLGSDRMAVAIGAYSLYPNKNVLSIDAGTCIKYNFVNAENVYLGGAISPGLPMRLSAMHKFTATLPDLKFDPTFETLIGDSTRSSMLSGALIGAACEVDGMIERYLAIYPDLTVVVTGGDAPYLCRQLKNRFFAHQYLLLQGLHTILLHNRQPLN